MIPDKIKALFKFIKYLHSNIGNFKQFNSLIIELEKLDKARRELKPEKNYKDKLKHDKVQAEIGIKFKKLQDGTVNLIKAKARELKICDPDKTETLWNYNISEIDKLKKEFDESYLDTIFEYKKKYIQFRTETNHNYFSLGFFFDDLDEILKELFDYFKESENENEFEKFESKEIKVDSIALMLKLFKEKRNPCKCELEFLTEKQHLCNDCSLKTEIENGVINQIEFQINEQQEILTKEQFNNWLDDEITIIQNSIKKLTLQKSQSEKGQITIFKNAWNRTYIFNKESIKVLNRYKASFLKALQSQPINESPFSVLEWATIFYYADETKLLSENRTIIARIEQFINKYQIDTTIKYFKTQYYSAKKRINEKNDYPISKLELIIPFLKENYKQTVTKVENDIIFLEENKPDY